MMNTVKRAPHDRRRGLRIYKPLKLIFYYMGKAHEVFSVNLSSYGAFIKTDVFPSIGSYIIFEHYHLKQKGITLGLVGKIKRVQKQSDALQNLKGIGVEWIRLYCNQGFTYLKNFMERDLNFQKFTQDIVELYSGYDKKIIFDYSTFNFNPPPEEMLKLKNEEKPEKIDFSKKETIAFEAIKKEAKPKEKSDTEKKQPDEKKDSPVFSEPEKKPMESLGISTEAQRKKVSLFEASLKEAPETETGYLYPVNIKIVFSIGNRMFYGRVTQINEKFLMIESSSKQGIKKKSKLQVRLPLSTKGFRYIVVVSGFVEDIVYNKFHGFDELKVRIQYVDELQNPGGFRYFIQRLKPKQ